MKTNKMVLYLLKRKQFIQAPLLLLKQINKLKMILNIIENNYLKLMLKKLAPLLLIEMKKMKIWSDSSKKQAYSSNNKIKSKDINKFKVVQVEVSV